MTASPTPEPGARRARATIARLARHGSAALVATFALAAGAHADDHANWATRLGFGGIKGSGQIETERRAITGFQGVALKGSFKLVLRQAGSERVEVRADRNLLAIVETRVVDRNGVATLEIRERANTSWSAKDDPVVTVDVVDLKALTISGSGGAVAGDLKTAALDLVVSGSGNLEIPRVDAVELALRLSGSGNVKLGGKAGKIAIRVSGSGQVDAFALATDDAAVSVSGSGNVKVDAKKTLAVAVSGSGDVAYTGDPKVSSTIGGSGTVKRR